MDEQDSNVTASGRRSLSSDDLSGLVTRALQFLEASPRGASRRDILSALQVNANLWPTLRGAMEDTGQIVTTGRGPGLRHVHRRYCEHVVPPAPDSRVGARDALLRTLRDRGEIDSRDAQDATGLNAEAVRRLLRELVRAGRVVRLGRKRSTRYRWKG